MGYFRNHDRKYNLWIVDYLMMSDYYVISYITILVILMNCRKRENNPLDSIVKYATPSTLIQHLQ